MVSASKSIIYQPSLIILIVFFRCALFSVKLKDYLLLDRILQE